MADKYSNPFQGIDISIPTEYHDSVVRYSQRESGANTDESPFPRMVDLWFFAICLAARNGLVPLETSTRETKKIIEGSIFSSDPWRINAMMLVVAAQTKNLDILAEPRKMMGILNGLATAGLPLALDMLRDGKGDAIWNLSEGIEALIRG